LGLNLLSQTSFVPGSHQAGSPLFLLRDGHGSTRILTTSTGSIAVAGSTPQIFTYDAYGNPIGFNPAHALTSFLYSGEQTDPGTNLQHLGDRYYDPTTGRFTQSDTYAGNISDPQSLNKYAYTQGDPINATDPTGHDAVLAVLAWLTGGGAALGALSLGTRAALKGATNEGIARDAAVGAALGALPGAGLLLAFYGGGIVALGAGLLLTTVASAAVLGEVVGVYQKDSAVGVGGLDVTNWIPTLLRDYANVWRKAGHNKQQQMSMDILGNAFGVPANLLVNAFGGQQPGALAAWYIDDMEGNKKGDWAVGVRRPVLSGTLSYQDHVYAVAEANYMLWGIIQHTANNAGINRFSTSYKATMSLAFLYRATAGAALNMGLWIQNAAIGQNPFAATMYETISGKLAFVDHGWDLVGNIAAAAPVEASLGFFNSVVPSGVDYRHKLTFFAAPFRGGFLLHN
jgi:RHS repeat-associated protein